MTNAALRIAPDAGNPHVRFDEEEVASAATPRRGSLFYRANKMQAGSCKLAMAFAWLFATSAAAFAAITYEEEIPAFRNGVDAYRVHPEACGEWSDGKYMVSVFGRRNFYMNYSRYPGMKPFRGMDEIVLVAEPGDIGKATAELVLFDFPGKGGKRRFFAPLAREMRFKTKLDPAKKYQLGIIGINRAQKGGQPWKIAFTSLRGVFTTTKADALCVEAETGNPLHIVRTGQDESPVLSIRNRAQERIAARGVLKVCGFRGEAMDFPVDVALEGGQVSRIPIGGDLKKGVWKITGGLNADDGSIAKVDTRFAVMDYHGKSAKQPMGTFRLGVNWHFPRFTKSDRDLAAAAMVACGAKLTRADVATMKSIRGGGPDSWNFSQADELMETIESNGLSLDAIIFSIPKWAARPEAQTNSDWKAWAHARPVPGAFERFCEALSARYGKRIDYYEIGNEWDIGGFRGTREDAAEVLREAYAGLKRGCPDCCVSTCGWAVTWDTPQVVRGGNAGLHETILRQCQDSYDVHAIHCHGSFAKYVMSIRRLFALRDRTGSAGKPWFSNETAITSVWNERVAALTVWKKILWAWANGSVDYVWYNLKGTGWNPKDSEQGYGLITADFRPRDSYVAFASLATIVGGATFRRTVFGDCGRYGFEFAKNGVLVFAGWLESDAVQHISVKTDAVCAWHVDLMGNRKELPVADGKVGIDLSSEPCAVVFRRATFAEPEASAAPVVAAEDSRVFVIPADRPGRAPDFVLDKPEQVHDFFEGNPSEKKRLWNGPNDNSARAWLSKSTEGLRLRVEVEDDVHSQPYGGAEQYRGDDVQVAFAVPDRGGQWEFGLAHCDDGHSDVHCWIAPDGFKAGEAAGMVELKTSRTGTTTFYDALFPYSESAGYTAKLLEDGFRLNLMVNDNDGDGRDATIEIVPNTFHLKDMTLAPLVRAM